MPLQKWYVIFRLRLAVINLFTKFAVSMFTYYEDMKRQSSM